MKRLWLICLAVLMIFSMSSALSQTLESSSSEGTDLLVKTDRAGYFFSKETDEAQRARAMERLEAFLDILGEKDFTIRFQEDGLPYARSSVRSARLPLEDETGLFQAIGLLQAIHGEFTHYGLIFGMADTLCKAAGLQGHTRRYNDKGMLRFYNEESNLSDFMLLYPCFTKEYNDEKQLPFVKDMAVRFCDFLAEKNQLLPLLQEKDAARFQAAFIPLMNEFMKNAGAETQLYTHLPPIQFSCGGEDIPLLIQTAHGEWHLYQGFSDPVSYWAEGSFDTLFNLIWQVDDNLKMVDDALGITPAKRVFTFRNAADDAGRSLYIHNKGDASLSLSSLSSVVHEYTHAVTAPLYTGENNWFLSELAATYFEIQGKENPQDGLWYTLRYDLPRDQEAYWGPVLDAMEKGSPISSWPKAEEIYHYLCYSQKQYDLFTPGSRTLNSLRSFAYYLKEHYGNEKMGPVFAAASPVSILHKDWPTLQAEWQQHLQSLFGQGSTI